MKSNEFIKQFNVWLLMEFILDDIEHRGLTGDCQVEHYVNYVGHPMGPDPFTDNADYDSQVKAFGELKTLEAINYKDTSDGFVIGSAKMTLDVKREVFDGIYKNYVKMFYSLGAEEREAVSNLNKEDLEKYNKFLGVLEFHLKYAEGLRKNQCRLTLSIPFSDFGDMTRLEIFQLAEKIEEQFKVIITPKALPPDSLLIGVYSKSKLNDLLKAIECALGVTETIKKSINKLAIVDSGSRSYKFVINDDYQNYLESSQGRKYWELFLQTAQNLPLEKEKYKGYFDYINSNKNNPFFKVGYSKSKLLTVKDGCILPNIPMEVIGEKAFKERLNKQNKA